MGSLQSTIMAGSFLAFFSFFNILSKTSASTRHGQHARLCSAVGGIVLREPSVVAVDANSNEVFSHRQKAKEMLGRTPESITAVRR